MIEIRNLNKSYPIRKGVFQVEHFHVLKDIDLNIYKNEILALVGESGSGKSTLARLILGMETFDSGELRDLQMVTKSVVFQNYLTSVNHKMSVENILKEPIPNQQVTQQTLQEALAAVHLPPEFLQRYPNQLSGGQLQRVCIARAIISEPDLIVFDEALSSLDVSVQLETMNLLRELKQRTEVTYLFITHDLASVTYMCDRVAFMKHGEIVEVETVNNLKNLTSTYAKDLFEAALYTII